MSDLLLQIVQLDPETGNTHVHSWRINGEISDFIHRQVIGALGPPKCQDVSAGDARKIMDIVKKPQ